MAPEAAAAYLESSDYKSSPTARKHSNIAVEHVVMRAIGRLVTRCAVEVEQKVKQWLDKILSDSFKSCG